MLLAVMGLPTFAGHYSVEKSISTLKVEGAINTMKEEIDTDLFKYKLVCQNEAYSYSMLKDSKINEYISETGQVHLISELLHKYENVLENIKETTFEINGKQDVDVFYMLTKKDNKYTIDIYTGEDANKMNNTHHTK